MTLSANGFVPRGLSADDDLTHSIRDVAAVGRMSSPLRTDGSSIPTVAIPFEDDPLKGTTETVTTGFYIRDGTKGQVLPRARV